MASPHKLISRGDWALIPLNEDVAFSVSWKQDGVSQREKYYLVESFWSSSPKFEDPKPGLAFPFPKSSFSVNRP
jgi:hypothetical protein